MSTTNPVSSSGASNPLATTTNTPVLPTQTLGEQDFLNLLVTQMTNQDPLSPMNDTDFVAQMAQFTSLQQVQTMQNDLATMQANGLLGRQVVLQADPQTTVTGVVSSMQMSNGAPQIVVNGQAYGLSTLLAVSPAPTTP